MTTAALTVDQNCPNCNATLFGSSRGGESERARPGQICMCDVCAAVLKVNADHRFTLVSDREIQALSEEMRESLKSAREWVLRTRIQLGENGPFAPPPIQSCPVCQKTLFEGPTKMGEHQFPDVDALGICNFCFAILIFDQRLKLQPFTEDEINALPALVRNALIKARDEIKRASSEGEPQADG